MPEPKHLTKLRRVLAVDLEVIMVLENTVGRCQDWI